MPPSTLTELSQSFLIVQQLWNAADVGPVVADPEYSEILWIAWNH